MPVKYVWELEAYSDHNNIPGYSINWEIWDAMISWYVDNGFDDFKWSPINEVSR